MATKSTTKDAAAAGFAAAEQIKTAVTEANDRAKTAMEKNAKIIEELAELSRGNVEAFVASSKVAAKGDFRVQPDWGGHVSRAEPDTEEHAAAKAALAAVSEPLLYARVDLVRDLDDRPVVMELELLEPDLYLGEEAAAQERFARAVLARA